VSPERGRGAPKRASHVLPSPSRGESYLRDGASDADQDIIDNAQTYGAADFRGQKASLVVSSLCQAAPVQRNGDDGIHGEIIAQERFNCQPPQEFSQPTHVGVLEAMNGGSQWSLEIAHGANPVYPQGHPLARETAPGCRHGSAAEGANGGLNELNLVLARRA